MKLDKILELLGLDGFKTWCVVRNPVEKLVFWFNFRKRPVLKSQPRYLGDKSFSEFWDTLIEKDKEVPMTLATCVPRTEYARILRCRMLMNGTAS
ncbi:MAG: hypothetical protein ABJN14_03260 [Paracoccaceae bacterium]